MRYLLVLVLSLLSLYGSSGQPQLDTARKYLYVREIGNNRGKEVDYFNRSVGNALGSQWCGAFFYTCTKNCKEPGVKSGLARNYYTKAKYSISAGEVLRKQIQIPAGWGVIWSQGGTIFGHVGLTESIWKQGKGYTIEGNTTSGKSGKQYDGGGVYKRYRVIQPYNYFHIIGFCRVR